MKRAVITGFGIVSAIGNNKEEVAESLKQGRSGIIAAPKMQELNFRSQVHGEPTLKPEEAADRRSRRFMGDGAAWNFKAMQEAIEDLGLTEEQISHPETGLVMGSGGPSTKTSPSCC